MRTELLRFNAAVERTPAIDAWMREHAGGLVAIAHHWFGVKETGVDRKTIRAILKWKECESLNAHEGGDRAARRRINWFR